ncbi:MAG: hypothetical protein WBN10_06805 [Polyangiales bacterium]
MGKRLLLAAWLTISTAACYPYLHSPPGRMVPVEAAKALPKGDVAIAGALSGGVGTLGPALGAGTLQGRCGFGHGFEGAVEAGFAVIGRRDSDWNTSASHALFSARTGFKYEAASWFAVQAGFGGGGSAAGGYVSPDAGIIFSYQGDHVVPLLAAGFFYSWPINPKAIVFTDEDSIEVLLPDKTVGGYGNLGLRIPLTDSENDGPRTALTFAYRMIFASHEEEFGRYADFYHLGVVSLDFVIRKRERSPESSGRRWELH